MTRATESDLDRLHNQVANLIANELDRAASRAALAPDDPAKAVSPQLISQALKLLSNAGVTAPLTAQRHEDVASKLADLGVDLDAEALGSNRPN